MLHGMGRSGAAVHALSGLDIALWDIRGKLEGVSVSTLLGGAKRKRVETYASLLQYNGNRRARERATPRARSNAAIATSSCTSAPPTRWPRRARWPGPTFRSWSTPTAPGRRPRPKRRSPRWRHRSRSGSRSRSGRRRISTCSPSCARRPACRWRWARTPPALLDFRKMVAAGAADFVQPSIVKIGGMTNLWQDRDRSREGRRHLRAACVLLRARLSRDAACHRLQGEDLRRWSACSPTSRSRPMRRPFRTRTAASTCPSGPGSAPIRRTELLERFKA